MKNISEFMNKVIEGNAIDKLKDIPDTSVDLIYIDPPFFTQREHSQKNRDNSKEYKFSDKWDTLEDYLKFIKAILLESKRALKNTGSFFLHCDKTASHYLRVLLDEVFGIDNFQSEIIWSYKRWSNAKKGLLNSHQNIYFYSKTPDFKFNTTYTDYSMTTNIDQILQDRMRDIHGKSQYKRDENGKAVISKEKLGVPLNDVWEIPFLNPKAKERTGYPTQKPILLLERIIKIVTDEGDTILDPVCGSGTTLVAAKLLNRNYIGIDISPEAIKLSHKRLDNPQKTESRLLEVGSDDYNEKTEEEMSILTSLGANPVQRNKGIDGFLKKHYHGKPVSIKIQKNDENLEEAKEKLITASKSKGCGLMILIKTKSSKNSSVIPEENLLVIDSYALNIERIFLDS